MATIKEDHFLNVISIYNFWIYNKNNIHYDTTVTLVVNEIKCNWTIKYQYKF